MSDDATADDGSVQLTVNQRLAFIRYLFEQGNAQADLPRPMSSASILSWHDAVEQFLRLVVHRRRVTVGTHVQFMEYWGLIQPKLPRKEPLPVKAGMSDLNELRVQLKHRGTYPSDEAIEDARQNVATFFREATQQVFKVDFTTISMIDVVPRTETVDRLNTAEGHAGGGDLNSALAWLVVALDELVEHYTMAGGGSRSPLSFGPTVRSNSLHSAHRSEERELLADVSTVVSRLQATMRVVALGIDYPSYAHLLEIAPKVSYGLTSDGARPRFGSSTLGRPHTEKDYLWGRSFVIECALRVAATDRFVEERINRPRERPNVRLFRPSGSLRPGGRSGASF